jgi:hypothetical protein
MISAAVGRNGTETTTDAAFTTRWTDSRLRSSPSFLGLDKLRRFCRSSKTRYVTLHGLRSFFVTKCRESGLPDTEIAALIGDKTGPAIIARTYGDVLPEHLLRQAKRVRFPIREKGQTYGSKMAAGA